MSLYQLEHLTRAYGRRIVLSIDQLEIEAGRMYALLGPNGAGKTTLLNLLAFLDEPTTGSLRFRGKAVGSDRAERLALRRQVVLVDQHPRRWARVPGRPRWWCCARAASASPRR